MVLPTVSLKGNKAPGILGEIVKYMPAAKGCCLTRNRLIVCQVSLLRFNCEDRRVRYQRSRRRSTSAISLCHTIRKEQPASQTLEPFDFLASSFCLFSTKNFHGPIRACSSSSPQSLKPNRKSITFCDLRPRLSLFSIQHGAIWQQKEKDRPCVFWR